VPGNCFFAALGYDRNVLPTLALQAAYAMPMRTSARIVQRLLNLLVPGTWVNALDAQIFVTLLPAWFPNGPFIFSAEGLLLHFRSSQAPESLLPEESLLSPLF
jgi:hypothetical protein